MRFGVRLSQALCIPHVSAPILVLQGKEDMQAPTSLVEEFIPQIEAPRKDLVIFKGEGHTALLSNPDVFLKELVAWVRPLVSE